MHNMYNLHNICVNMYYLSHINNLLSKTIIKILSYRIYSIYRRKYMRGIKLYKTVKSSIFSVSIIFYLENL